MSDASDFHSLAHAFAYPETNDYGLRVRQFQDLSEMLVPGWFEWHGWTNKIVEAGVRRRWIALAGCSGCVAGETKLLNPITGEQPCFEYLHRNNIAPMVMTLDGPRQAGVPFVKGIEDLFEVELSNGSRFVATAEHVVLSASGFAPLKSLSRGQVLFSYGQFPRESTSELARSTHVSSARSSRKTVEGSRSDCPISDRCDGEPLRLAIAVARLPAPLHTDVPKRNHARSHLDDLACAVLCSRAHLSSHPSNSGSCRHHSSFDTLAQCPHYPKMNERDVGSSLCGEQFHLTNDLLFPKLGSNLGFLNKHLVYTDPASLLFPSKTLLSSFGLFELLLKSPKVFCENNTVSEFPFRAQYTDPVPCPIDCHDASSLLSTVSQATVVSIRKTSRNIFYDISVPGPEHYFAEGAIHHNSAKTRNVSGFACSWWLADPENSSVILCSTTMKMLRKRAWAEVQNYKDALQKQHGDFPGNFVNSQTVWQHDQGDDKHAIFGIAVAEGDINKSAANIQGIHTKRQMVIIDEAEAVPGAIWKSAFNLWSYPVNSGGEFIFIAIANPRSRLSQFGRYIEPAKGWDSVSVDSDDWDSIPQLDGKRALVLRFDFKKSPNLLSDKPVSKHLPSKRAVNARLRALEEKGGAENDPEFWAMDRGFPAPEGLSKTVFTATMIAVCKAQDRHVFTGRQFTIIGAFDPAYGGGDRPALRFAALGEIEDGVLGIEMMEAILLFPDASNSGRPIRYQLVDMLKEHCANVTYRNQKYVCPQENLAIDCTGDGGVGDIAQQEKMPNIIRIQFGGSASDDPVSHEDGRKASSVFKNKRAEMFFRSRNATQSNQLRGIDKDTAEELCQLEYFDKRPDQTLKPITIIDKALYKDRYGKSPDLADSFAMIVEVARIKGFKLRAVGTTIQVSLEFNSLVEKTAAVYSDINYSAENEAIDVEAEVEDFD